MADFPVEKEKTDDTRSHGARVASSRLPHSTEHLFGREQELAGLDAAWQNPQTHILTFIAWGGVGKTSLVAHWMAQMAADDWRGAERVFDWSFYSQGTREQGAASADQFIAKALEFFGDTDPTQGSPWDKGERLAQLVAQQRSLLVLDGLEPLQYPPGPQAGKLKDPALQSLLTGLARNNPGLCVVTTRESLDDLKTWRGATTPERTLEHLSEEAGASLLRKTGVQGTDAELREASREVRGHALTLNLLGRYLFKAHHGDIRKRGLVKFEKVDARVQGGHAFKVMAAYEKWLAGGGEEGQRQLALLRLMGLFDRPADPDCLAALRAEPPIAGLTDALAGLSDEEWNLVVSDLQETGLVQKAAWERKKLKGFSEEKANQRMQSLSRGYDFPLGEPQVETPASVAAFTAEAYTIETHPLVQEYFAKQLREQQPEAWFEGHRRLYEHLKASVPYWPEGLDGLQPLYQAVVHGCQAGLHQQVCGEVYFGRINRGNESYSTRKVCAIGADLEAVACFFDIPWHRLALVLSDDWKAWLFNEAAVSLRAIGRVKEAIEPTRAGISLLVQRKDWTRAAGMTSNLSELELTLGEVAAAVQNAEQSVVLADRSGEWAQRMTKRVTLAHTLHQAGRWAEALECFREAEVMQAENQPFYPLLYSIQGYRYCDLLLAETECAAWQSRADLPPAQQHQPGGSTDLLVRCDEVAERVAKTQKWVEEATQDILSCALDYLTQGRTTLYRALLDQSAACNLLSATEPARRELNAAVNGLRVAGQQEFIVRGLLSLSLLRFVEGDVDGASADLDDAWQIAERGSMRLHMADILLTRARLFHNKSDLAAARKLIEQCGYWRRKEELEDAEAAATQWPNRLDDVHSTITLEKSVMSTQQKRFRVALSFPGEHRAFVEQVAARLASGIGSDRVLYDRFYEPEFARPDLDTYLQRLYHDESELVVVFLCADYERKEWCGLEWRALRDLIKQRQSSAIMPLRFDNTEIPGLFSTDGYIWIGNRSPEEVADLILQRMQVNASHSTATSPSVASITSPAPAPPHPTPLTTPSSALAIWQQKLAFLQAEEAKTSDAGQKFTIRQGIEEAKEKIRELGGRS